MSATSTIPVAPGAPNPYYHKAQWLLSNQVQFTRMQEWIRREAHHNPQLTFAELRAMAKDKFFEQFTALIKEFEAVEPPKAVINPPPTPRDLYGRFAAKINLTDIGSGNCMKLRASSGQMRITAVDPLIPESEKIRRLTIKVDRRLFVPGMYLDTPLSSFNALVSLDAATLEHVLHRDGLHIVPDHRALLEDGVCVREGDTVKVPTPSQVYEDNYLDFPGWALKPHYKLLATFTPIKASFATYSSASGTGWKKGTGYVPFSEARPANEMSFDWQDVGFKFDGLFRELWMDGKKFRLYDRVGRYLEGTCDTDMGRAILHVEEVSNKNTTIYVLLRISLWHNMIPPHCGETLRHFAREVQINIDGYPLVGPPAFDGSSTPVVGGELFPIDGLISRNVERDYYCKPTWTADLYPDGFVQLQRALDKQGILMEGVPRPGLWEYNIKRQDGTVEATPLRKRDDKTQATPTGTCEYLLSLPTLFEMAAIFGDAPYVEGLRPFLI